MTGTASAEPVAEPVRRSRALLPLDLLRGFLIGMAELVPGVLAFILAPLVVAIACVLASIALARVHANDDGDACQRRRRR